MQRRVYDSLNVLTALGYIQKDIDNTLIYTADEFERAPINSMQPENPITTDQVTQLEQELSDMKQAALEKRF